MILRGLLVALACLIVLFALLIGRGRLDEDPGPQEARNACLGAIQALVADPTAFDQDPQVRVLVLYAVVAEVASEPGLADPAGKALEHRLRHQLATGQRHPRTTDTVAALIAIGQWRTLPGELRHAVEAVNRRPGPRTSGWLILGLLSALCGLGLGWIAWRMRRGPEPIDPQAETLENIEPIDVDTDSITLDDGQTTAHETGTSSTGASAIEEEGTTT